MYNRLKKLIVIVTLLLIAIAGNIFINAHKSEILGGYREVIVVDKSTVDFAQVLQQYSKDHHLILAKRIVEASHDGSGNLQNTYVPIGANKLPSALPMQKNKTLIDNSSDNTLYIIVSDNISATQVAKDLTAKHNSVRVLPNNSELVIFRLLLSMPQSLLIILGVLVTYASLVLTEYISSMKEVGVRRISGEGKHSIALQQTYRDSVFILIVLIILVISNIVTLLFTHNLSILTLMIVSLPVIFLGLVILILNFFLAHLFYYILQHQPIILSIKGKAPMKLVFFVIIITQVITLLSVMYCVLGLNNINKDLYELNRGQQEWQKFSRFYGIISLDDGDSVSKQQKINFFKELNDKTTIIYRQDMLDNIAMLNVDNAIEYAPTPDAISHVIYVNDNYIKLSGGVLSKEMKTFIEQMQVHDKLILLPQAQKNNFAQLSQQWHDFEERGFLPKDAKFVNQHPQATIKVALYQGGDMFSYPLYSSIGRIFSNVTFLKDPIIIVKRLDDKNMIASDLLTDKPQVVLDLIKKHKVTAAYGSLTNGLRAIELRVQDIITKKYLLLTSTILSIVSSALLFIVMNKIYFYQGRRVHFIERLSGKSLLMIHKIYLTVVSSSYVVMSIGALILGLSPIVATVPLAYLTLLFIIFFWQLFKEKKANILYLKGE